MRHCVIHVGMHKTGTSSIQQSLNRFADDAFLYADINGHPNHSGPVFEMFDLNPDRRLSPSARQLPSRMTRDDAFAALERTIRAAGERTFILSGEGIALLRRLDLQRMRDHLAKFFDRLTVVAAVRAPAGYMASAYQEPVKRGTLNALDVPKQYRSYEKTFAKFDELFGRGNVRLWKFDPKSFPGGCAVRDFCSRLGIDMPEQRIVRVNESLSREAFGLLFIYRKLGAHLGSMSMNGPQNFRLVQQLMKIGGGRFRFSPDVLSPILEARRTDIDWMEARLGQSLHEDLGEHRSGDVRDEADLLNPDPAAVRELLRLLGDRAPRGNTGSTPEHVAVLVHALRGEPSANASVRPAAVDRVKSAAVSRQVRVREISMSALLGDIRKECPQLLNGVPEAETVRLVQGVFRHIGDRLGKIDDGAVNVVGLGKFRVKKVVNAAAALPEGKKRIVFQASSLAKEP